MNWIERVLTKAMTAARKVSGMKNATLFTAISVTTMATFFFTGFGFGGIADAVSRLTSPSYVSVDAPAFVTIGFSPNGWGEKLVLDTMKKANRSLDVAAYSFTNSKIAQEAVNAQKRGVKVRAVLDGSNEESASSSAQFLANRGVEVRMSSKYPVMNHKFMVVDGNYVQLGSLNYSKAAAERNAENVVVLESKDVAKTFMLEFNRLWRESKAYSR